MADVFTRAKRSAVMSLIRSRGNRATELRLISLVREHGIIAAAKAKRQHTRPGAAWEIRLAKKARLGSFAIGDRTAKAVISDGDDSPSKRIIRKP